MIQPDTQKINARADFLILFRHNIPSAAKIIRDLYYRGVSSGVLVTRNQVPLPNENLKNLYHQARACDMNSPLIASINSFFNVSNAKNIDHNHRLPTLGYTFVFPLGQGAIARVFSLCGRLRISDSDRRGNS